MGLDSFTSHDGSNERGTIMVWYVTTCTGKVQGVFGEALLDMARVNRDKIYKKTGFFAKIYRVEMSTRPHVGMGTNPAWGEDQEVS